MTSTSGTQAQEVASPAPVAHMQKIDIGPDDVVVVTYPSCLSVEQRQRSHANMTKYFPDNKVVIFEGGAQMGVVSPQSPIIPKASNQGLMQALDAGMILTAEPDPRLDVIIALLKRMVRLTESSGHHIDNGIGGGVVRRVNAQVPHGGVG